MHDGDKVDRIDIGELLQKDGKNNCINIFPPGVAIMKKLRDQENYEFSTVEILHQVTKTLSILMCTSNTRYLRYGSK